MNEVLSQKSTEYYEVRQSFMILAAKIFMIEISLALTHFFVDRIIVWLEWHEFIIMGLPVGTLELIIFHIGNIAFVLAAVSVWVRTTYKINSRTIVTTAGILNRQEHTHDIQGIQEIKVLQNLLGKLFRYGSINLKSTLGTEAILKNIPRPQFYAEIIERHYTKEKPEN
jgi:uncharacterized membrane protein YdbT with pleckstrin-like domain